MLIRLFKIDDADELAKLFFRSVREAGKLDYTAEQVMAWCPALPSTQDFIKRMNDGRLVLVAVNDSHEIIGYGELEKNGHIDHLYCRPDVIGMGVGSALYNALEGSAIQQGLHLIYVEASEAARRMFSNKGFKSLGCRTFLYNGVTLHNYRMEKALTVPL